MTPNFSSRTFRIRRKDPLMKWKTLMLAALFSSASLIGPGAKAAGSLEKLITIVVPFPAGSTSDTIPQLIGALVCNFRGVPVIIEKRGGRNGTRGALAGASPARH